MKKPFICFELQEAIYLDKIDWDRGGVTHFRFVNWHLHDNGAGYSFYEHFPDVKCRYITPAFHLKHFQYFHKP